MSLKKVIIVTYYWPPSGGSGVQRWLKFAKYLPEFGWDPIIVTPSNPPLENFDQSLSAETDKMDVRKLPIWEPQTLLGKRGIVKQGIVDEGKSILKSFIRWVRANLMIPDQRIFWKGRASSYILRLIDEENVSTVITTGPPHSMHLIGLSVKRKRPQINWVADFRDQWSRWDLLDSLKVSEWARKKHKMLEGCVLKQADAVIATSPMLAKSLIDLGGRRVEVLTNGYDADDFDFEVKEAKEFLICHFGLMNEYRDPSPLLSAIKKLAQANPEILNEVKLNFTGTINSDLVTKIQLDTQLSQIVQINKPVSHQEVVKAYSSAAILLVIVNDSQEGMVQLPGKIFEYLAVGKPILAIGHKECDTANLLNQTGAGVIFQRDQIDELAVYLAEALDRFKTGELTRRNKSSHLPFARKSITKQLAEMLERLPR